MVKRGEGAGNRGSSGAIKALLRRKALLKRRIFRLEVVKRGEGAGNKGSSGAIKTLFRRKALLRRS